MKMRAWIFCGALALAGLSGVVMLGGCVYEVPLTEEASGAVDAGVLGVWEEADPSSSGSRMMVLKWDEASYLVHYPTSEGVGVYFRAYPIKVGGLECVQVQAIGSAKDDQGPLPEEERKYHVVRYELKGEGEGEKKNELVVSTLNTDIISLSLTTSEKLKNAVEAYAGAPDLFWKPSRFVRVSGKE